ncbi:MAG TPA: sigma-70 family RNA polymerase sigma factor [Acidimicrobiia bacterium]
MPELTELPDDDVRRLSDTRLVVGIARMDEEALAEVHRRYGGAVVALAQRVLANRALAEDVAQDVFVGLWKHPTAFDPDRGSLRSYLLTRTHGRSVDLVRAERARRSREERSLRLARPVAGDVEREAWLLFAGAQARAALDALSDGERSAIELAYFGGLTYQQVATQLGEPEGTIKSRIRAGLARMRSALRAEGIEEPWQES